MAEAARNDAGSGGAMGSAGTAVKEGIVESLKGLNEVETAIVNLVRSTVAQTLKATGEVASDSVTVTRDVITGRAPGHCRGGHRAHAEHQERHQRGSAGGA
jgi:hypothetical protein